MGAIQVRSEFGFEMGMTVLDRTRFLLHEDNLSVHSCVLGQSGSGKSKFLEQKMRYLMAAGRGFTLIDPHGDLSEDLLAFAMYRNVVKGDRPLLDRIHYLEPSYEQVFCYDPFKFKPLKEIPAQHEEAAYRSFLHAKVQAVAEILQRKQNQFGFEGMPRLERVLTNVLTAVGTAVERTGPKKGKHLPLADAMVLLDVSHDRHKEVYRLVSPFLDSEIRSEFERWQRFKNSDQLLRETESTINRLRSFLSPLVKGIFCDQVDTIDFHSIIQNDEILLVNLRETDYFSADQAKAIGGLFIHEILSSAQNTPRKMRKRHYLIVDEAGDFIGADIQRALGIMRKFELPICLAAQDLSSFIKGELDLRPKVLSQCGTIITFRQTWPDDLEILARVLGTGNLDFRKHYQIVDRPDGYEFVPMKTYSQSFAHGDSWDESRSNGFSTTQSETHSEQHTTAEGNQTSTSRSHMDGRGNQHSEMRGHGGSTGHSQREGHHHRTVSEHDTWSRSSTDGMSIQSSDTESSSDAHTSTNSVGTGTAMQNGSQHSQGTGKSRGGSATTGLSINDGFQALAKTREEQHETPSLMNLISDQFEKMKQQLHSLPQRHAIAKLLDAVAAFVFEVVFVDEKWLPEDKYDVIEKTKLQLQNRSYFTHPQVGDEAQEKRLQGFLEDTKHSPTQTRRTAMDIEQPVEKDSPFGE